MKPLYILFGLAALVSLAGCGEPPSQTDAETYWRNLLANSNGLIRLVSFAKTDGKTDQGHYTLYYAVTYEFADDCQYDSNFRAKQGLPKGLDFFGAMGTGQTIGKKDHRILQTGQMVYEKRERGWQLVNVVNGRFSDSTPHGVVAAEQKQQEDIAREKSQERERLNALMVKSKERHETIATQAIWNEDSISSKFTWQAVLSDSDISVVSPSGQRTVWFGDIHAFNYYDNPDSIKVSVRHGTDMLLTLPDRKQLVTFYNLLLHTFDAWQKQYQEIRKIQRWEDSR